MLKRIARAIELGSCQSICVIHAAMKGCTNLKIHQKCKYMIMPASASIAEQQPAPDIGPANKIRCDICDMH